MYVYSGYATSITQGIINLEAKNVQMKRTNLFWIIFAVHHPFTFCFIRFHFNCYTVCTKNPPHPTSVVLMELRKMTAETAELLKHKLHNTPYHSCCFRCCKSESSQSVDRTVSLLILGSWQLSFVNNFGFGFSRWGTSNNALDFRAS